MKIKTKKTLLKYFRPIDKQSIIPISFDDETEIENSLGNLSYHTASGDNAKFLDRLSSEDFQVLMDKVGLTEHLQKMGFTDIIIAIRKDEVLIHHFQVYNRNTDPDNMLINLRVSESRFVPERHFFEDEESQIVLDMVIIEWLSAQNPFNNYDNHKPQLPGQNRPGLGSLKYMMEIMYLVGANLHIDGFMDVPNHLHGAVMYSRKFKFFNPAHEAILQAMLRDLKDYSMADLSWGMLTRTIVETTSGEPQNYDPSEQIFPVSQYMKNYFNSKKYQKKFEYIYKKKSYHFDYEKMLILREKILQKNKLEDL